MSPSNQERIDEVIARFRESLSDAAREHVTEAHLEDLSFMIQEVVADELKRAVEFMEDALGKLRARVLDEKPDLSL
jgi:hypothetical protein